MAVVPVMGEGGRMGRESFYPTEENLKAVKCGETCAYAQQRGPPPGNVHTNRAGRGLWL